MRKCQRLTGYIFKMLEPICTNGQTSMPFVVATKYSYIIRIFEYFCERIFESYFFERIPALIEAGNVTVGWDE